MSAQQWKSLLFLWQNYCKSNTSTKAHCSIEHVFANCSKENEKYPLTTAEIAEAQQAHGTSETPL
jgi:hypothetical protein